MLSTLTPRARIICGLSPAACMAVPRLVLKKRYRDAPAITAIASATASTAPSRVPTSHPSGCTTLFPSTESAADSAIDASVRSDRSGRLLFPITCRFTE